MLIAIQATIQKSDIAVATATFSFIVLLGTTLGIAIGGTVFQNQMTDLAGDLPDIPLVSAFTGEGAGAAIQEIQNLPDNLRGIVVSNYAKSMRMVWIIFCVFAAAGFITSFFIGTHELFTEYGYLISDELILVFAQTNLR
jgi:hypothetical protein